MKINRAYRYELKVNIQERILLAKHAGAARFAYNWGLQQRIEQYEREKTFTNAIEQHRLLNSLKQSQFPWMYEVSKCAPQEALRDLDKAFRNFSNGRKRNVGFPKFKKKGVHDSFRLTGTIKVDGKSIQLPRLGRMRLKELSHVTGRILSATVTKEADRWYVSLTVEEERPDAQPVIGDVVAIDVGLTDFAIFSSGEKIQAPKPLQKALQRIKRLSKRHSRKVKGSKNKKKSAILLARLHRKVRNIRQDFLHKISTKLTKTKSAIVIEDLDVKGLMQKASYSRHIADVGWGGFRRMLEYKAKWHGSKLIVVDRYFASSRICSGCKAKRETLPLCIREWTCLQCGAVHDRDVNAAKNLLQWSTESSSGIHACGDSSGSGMALCQSTSHESLNQEVMNGIFVHKL